MQTKYALITICRDEVAPRFDMTAEVVLAPLSDNALDEQKHLVLAHVSSEELCDVITGAGVSVVVCGGIEENYYHYLRWKRIEVISDVIGKVSDVLQRLASGELSPGDCLYPKQREDLT